MEKNNVLNRVIKFLRENVPTKDMSKYMENGAIYYMNGNDSTPFDWNCNNRTCEFYMFWKENQMGAIKVFVRNDGTIEGYVYDTPNTMQGRQIKSIPIDDNPSINHANKAYRFKNWLVKNFDNQNKWDMQVA